MAFLNSTVLRTTPRSDAFRRVVSSLKDTKFRKLLINQLNHFRRETCRHAYEDILSIEYILRGI